MSDESTPSTPPGDPSEPHLEDSAISALEDALQARPEPAHLPGPAEHRQAEPGEAGPDDGASAPDEGASAPVASADVPPADVALGDVAAEPAEPAVVKPATKPAAKAQARPAAKAPLKAPAKAPAKAAAKAKPATRAAMGSAAAAGAAVPERPAPARRPRSAPRPVGPAVATGAAGAAAGSAAAVARTTPSVDLSPSTSGAPIPAAPVVPDLPTEQLPADAAVTATSPSAEPVVPTLTFGATASGEPPNGRRLAIVAAAVLGLAAVGGVVWALSSGDDDQTPRAAVTGSPTPSPSGLPTSAPTTAVPTLPPGPVVPVPSESVAPTVEPTPAATPTPTRTSGRTTSPAPRPTTARPTTAAPTTAPTTASPAPSRSSAAPAIYGEPNKGAPTGVSCTYRKVEGAEEFDIAYTLTFTGGSYDVLAGTAYGSPAQVRGGSYTWSVYFTITESDGVKDKSSYEATPPIPLRWADPGGASSKHQFAPAPVTVQRSSCSGAPPA